MKILIADDHELVRDTIAIFLEQEHDFKISRASDFHEASAKIIADGPFDLVLLDYNMPGMRALNGLTRAMQENGGKPVALMSGTAAKDVAEAALEAGAAGFLPKSMSASSLVHAVRFMLAGEQYAPVKYMMEKEAESEHPLASQLSNREMQVLVGLCHGLANKEIAKNLDLQEVTVKLHVKTLCRKLNARNRTQAAMIGRDAGIV